MRQPDGARPPRRRPRGARRAGRGRLPVRAEPASGAPEGRGRGRRDHERGDSAVRARCPGRHRRVQAGAEPGARVRSEPLMSSGPAVSAGEGQAAGYVLLEDGTRFDGRLCGAGGEVTGEIVFNTAMTGYQEAVSDPSYAGQIITFTYPLIGNY